MDNSTVMDIFLACGLLILSVSHFMNADRVRRLSETLDQHLAKAVSEQRVHTTLPSRNVIADLPHRGLVVAFYDGQPRKYWIEKPDGTGAQRFEIGTELINLESIYTNPPRVITVPVTPRPTMFESLLERRVDSTPTAVIKGGSSGLFFTSLADVEAAVDLSRRLAEAEQLEVARARQLARDYEYHALLPTNPKGEAE